MLVSVPLFMFECECVFVCVYICVSMLVWCEDGGECEYECMCVRY